MANGLAIQRENLESYLAEFLSINSQVSLHDRVPTGSQEKFFFIMPGKEIATVILYYKTTGLTTITYKTGKNHDLGLLFHDFLVAKCDCRDSEPVNLVLKGISNENVETLISDLKEQADESDKVFDITVHHPTTQCTKYDICSNQYKDTISINYYPSTCTLQIQGRALFCYRNITYLLSILLDQGSLLAVIERKSVDDKTILHEEIASEYIQRIIPNAYDRMDDTYKSLLISSYCVKLAAPKLPEYSMLVYADLRVLEGVIKETLMEHGLFTSSDKLDIGYYFKFDNGTELKTEHTTNFLDSKSIDALEQCYHYYRRNRHSLFHMEENGYEARTTDTLGEVMQISNHIASLIDAMYANCNKL
ncbi:type II toxin-antitoxin system RnlA family toxin [Photobacterium sanguinicancri]|uniref:Bacterial toxin RNase RnlA/LsoA DBD domain-containing protein n=1 Tax=Photobacterium sanguinicancri TaxID=875932 RepID=A0ABX4FUE1_9GAMM|nr:type II toxin-antitoxin system RnlA family toxin [Photobacterium sanguinicancri]OZS42487.1 hypothetical protein ASV53_18195 [Photobacterium sanguinicancri]